MEIKVPFKGWKIVREIGHGTFGHVYEIERDFFGDRQKSAMKIIPIPSDENTLDYLYGSGFDDASIRKWCVARLDDIRREYALMEKMKGNTNIVSCEDVEVEERTDGIGFIVYIRMELLTSLQRVLRTKAFTEADVIKVGKDICKALTICEKLNVIHRDIKPENIMVSDFGDYKLGDFGIARTLEHTTNASVAGTERYMAPEVIRGEKYGRDVDTYSLGLVMYWLLNRRTMPFMTIGQLPTAQEVANSQSRRITGAPLPRPVSGSDELVRIVLKACSFDRSRRYMSAVDMLRDLNALKAHEPAGQNLQNQQSAQPQQNQHNQQRIQYQRPQQPAQYHQTSEDLTAQMLQPEAFRDDEYEGTMTMPHMTPDSFRHMSRHPQQTMTMQQPVHTTYTQPMTEGFGIPAETANGLAAEDTEELLTGMTSGGTGYLLRICGWALIGLGVIYFLIWAVLVLRHTEAALTYNYGYATAYLAAAVIAGCGILRNNRLIIAAGSCTMALHMLIVRLPGALYIYEGNGIPVKTGLLSVILAMAMELILMIVLCRSKESGNLGVLITMGILSGVSVITGLIGFFGTINKLAGAQNLIPFGLVPVVLTVLTFAGYRGGIAKDASYRLLPGNNTELIRKLCVILMILASVSMVACVWIYGLFSHFVYLFMYIFIAAFGILVSIGILKHRTILVKAGLAVFAVSQAVLLIYDVFIRGEIMDIRSLIFGYSPMIMEDLLLITGAVLMIMMLVRKDLTKRIGTAALAAASIAATYLTIMSSNLRALFLVHVFTVIPGIINQLLILAALITLLEFIMRRNGDIGSEEMNGHAK